MQSSSSLFTTPSQKHLIAQNALNYTLNRLQDDSSDSSPESSVFDPTEEDSTERIVLVQQLKEVILKRKLAEIQNRFIRRKLVTYFKKKKINRAFIDGAKSDLPEQEARYEDILQTFAKTCLDEEQITVAQKNLHDHQNESSQKKSDLQKTISDYEGALMETGLTLISARTGELLSEKFIQSILARQGRARNRLSEQRLEYILAEKYANDTQEKLKKLDDLGDGLCMADFEQLRTELQYLTDKIEERNTDLNRLRLKCEADTQKLANIREKRDVVLQLIDEKEIENVDLEMEQHQVRDELNKLRIEYGKLKKKFDKMNVDSGLLNKSVLLLDYDATIDKIEALEMENEKYVKN